MPILFSAVAVQKTVVNRYASCDGNFFEIVEEVLKRISKNNYKMTYSHGKYLFHFIAENEHFYFCITNKQCQRSRAFLFLNEIRRRFEIDKIDFTRILAEEMYRFNEDYSTIVIRHGEIDEVNKIGVDSSESILGEKLLMVTNENNLSYSTIKNVETTPEQVMISYKDSKIRVLKVASLIIIATSLTIVFSPMSFAIIILILILYSVVR